MVDDEMGETIYSGEMRNAYKVLVGKPERKSTWKA
jgi:hypothetical protein